MDKSNVLKIEQNILKIIKLAFAFSKKEKKSKEDLEEDVATKKVISSFLCVASFVLTFMNLLNQYWLMMVTTAILGATFGICIYLSNDYKNHRLVSIILSFTIVVIFSYYAITGANEGFAILWILLVPPLAYVVLGLNDGTYVSAYYLIFLIVCFYTPLRGYFVDNYTNIFLIRFPVLYCVCFLASLIIGCQREYYKSRLEAMAYIDTLTGINNRREYEQQIEEIEKTKNKKDLILLTADINQLKYTNDNFGHSVGDTLIVDVAEFIKKTLPGAMSICRMGGDEFSIISYHDADNIDEIYKAFANYKFFYNGELLEGPSLSVGIASANEHPECSVKELDKLADQKMYEQKNEFYRKSGFNRRRV